MPSFTTRKGKKMNLDEYQALAMRTAKVFDRPEDNLSHAAIGFASELMEFACADEGGPTLLELGDMLWYPTYLAGCLKVPLSYCAATAASWVPKSTPPELVIACFLSRIKRIVFYGRELDSNAIDLLMRDVGALVDIVRSLAEGRGSSLEFVMETNINKLRARFPVAYSDAAALAQADGTGSNHATHQP